MAARFIQFLCLFLLCESGCRPAAQSADRNFAHLVIGQDVGELCSTVGRFVRAPANSAPVISLVDDIRAIVPSAFASHVDFGAFASVTISIPVRCSEVGADTRSALARMGGARGISWSDWFVPQRAGAGGDRAPAGLRATLVHLNGRKNTLEQCSIAMSVTEHARSPKPDLFELILADARDVYGLPILFTANKDKETFVSFYRSCDQIQNMFSTIQFLENRNTEMRVKTFRGVSTDDLVVYGSVL